MRLVVWSDEGRNDLIAIVGFIAQENPQAAGRVGDRIVTSVKDLGDFATGHPGRVKNTYEKAVSDLPYTISYTIDSRSSRSGTIVVLRIIHDARHWPTGGWP